MCGSIAALAGAVGTMLVADFAATYLMGRVLQVMPGQALGLTVAQIATYASQGVAWARTASKLMTGAKYMKAGWTVAKIAGGTAAACFDNETKMIVQKSDSELGEQEVLVKNIKVGDWVQARGENTTAWTKVTKKEVINQEQAVIEMTFDLGQTLVVTVDHHVIVDGKLKTAKDVCIDDVMIQADGKEARVCATGQKTTSSVVDIETEEGSVIANGIIVSTL